MKRIDSGKTSLVEFLASIKFSRSSQSRSGTEYSGRFAGFNPRIRTNRQFSVEDCHLIRSAN